MKTHFIFNQSVLVYSGIIPLVSELLENRFPVAIISDQFNTPELKNQIPSLNELRVFGRECGDSLSELYLKACPQIEEERYLTVVFESNSAQMKLAEQLGFFFIEIKNNNLQKIFKKLKISAAYQLQYLPEIKKIKKYLHYKLGYPASLYQCLRGEFTETGVSLKKIGEKLANSLPNTGNYNYFINNPGDPFFLSENFMGHTCIFEQEVINILGQYYGLPNLEARGFVTSGGTEGNFSGLWWARDNLQAAAVRAHQPIPKIAIYFSEAAHYSIGKIAEQLPVPRSGRR